MNQAYASHQSRSSEKAIQANRRIYWMARHWLALFSLVFGLYVGLPFLAPVFMRLNLELPARVIYAIYSVMCHQLPQRSYFLFGEQFTYSLVEIQAAWQNTTNAMVLRQFIGTQQMGWKVAWSDRMVSMYASVLIFGWLWYPLRNRLRRLSWRGLVLFLLPMALDGFSHMASDLAGMGAGFRDSNAWLAALTGNIFQVGFYAGDGWGSFNSIMRLVTGILFGAGIVWFGFPYLDEFFRDISERIEWKFRQKSLQLFRSTSDRKFNM